MTINNIPIIDISADQKKDDYLSHSLGEIFQNIGVCGIANHGLSPHLVNRALSISKKLFDLPEAIKKKYSKPHLIGKRGYIGLGIETAKDYQVSDLKEFWHIGRELETSQSLVNHTPNLWPIELSSFQSEVYPLYEALEKIAERILSLLAVYLKLPVNFFKPQVNEGNSVLRLLHYPPLKPHQTPAALRAAPHEDINLITLLLEATEPGLEFLQKDNTWLPVTVSSDILVMNVGDMMQRLTNGVLCSTTHRVINPIGVNGHRSRYAAPFFVHPKEDFLIQTLPSCIHANRPDQYPDAITAHDFLSERLLDNKLTPSP